MKNKSARVVSHGEGLALRAFGDEIVVHLDGQKHAWNTPNVDGHTTAGWWAAVALSPEQGRSISRPRRPGGVPRQGRMV